MKTKLVKSIIAPLLFACALAPMVAAETMPGGTEKAENFKGLGACR